MENPAGRVESGADPNLGAWRALATVAVLFVLFSDSASGVGRPARAPRPLSEAERAAVELAIAYHAGGASAWWDHLSDPSALRELGRDEAMRELEVRLGPAEGSTWELQTPGPSFGEGTAVFALEFPSGIEETVVLRLRPAARGWTVDSVEITVDPVSDPAVPAEPRRATTAFLALVAGSSLLAALWVGGGRRRRLGALSLMAVGLAASGISCGRSDTAAGSPRPGPAIQRLAPLAPLRSALCLGRSLQPFSKELAERHPDGPLDEVRRLWETQELLARGELAKVEQRLRAFPSPSRYPLAELMRARVAFGKLRRQDTGWAYDEATSRRLDDDGIRLEAAEAKSVTDDAQGAAIELSLLVEMGSRAAQAWYGATRFALLEDREADAEQLLRVAWRLQPIPRRDLFADPVLATLCARPGLFPLFELGSASEPAVEPEGPRHPLAFPSGTVITTSGSALRARIRGARLEIPGGALLAPEESPVVDAVTWTEEDEVRALSRLASLRVAAASDSDPLQPRLLRQAGLAAEALARQNRWRELDELTAPFAATPGSAPAMLVRLRALALGRLGRDTEARDLLIRLAVSDLDRHVPAPGTLYDLAELLARAGEYDRAIQLIRRADAQLPRPRGETRIRQLALDQVLSKSFLSYRSRHFDIRYPATSGEAYARKVATVLEQERLREGEWIPLVEGPRLEVHLFEVQPFFAAYGEMGVVGLFDGKVRVPFADLMSLHPELVRILSHELCHAMLAAATRDHAPAWFHEGLAQHVEMGTGRVNPLPDLRREGRAIAFPALGAILAGFAEPQFVELAYSESAWAVQFLESRWGVSGLRRLAAAYAAGSTDGEAIRAVTGLDLPAFDRAFWEWGSSSAPAVRRLDTRRFDEELDGPVERRSAGLLPPAAATGDPRPRGGTVRPATPESVPGWHRRYSARVAAAKQALRPVLAGYEPGAVPASPDACARLESEVASIRKEPAIFESPVRGANQALQDAYYQILLMASRCRAGRHDLAAEALVRARSRLAAAAAELEPFGVAP